MAIFFFSEIPGYQPENVIKRKQWIDAVIREEGKVPGDVNYIFVTDLQLLDLNLQYLERDYLTDVISFDYSENEKISGDVFISLERVRENAKNEEVSENEELNRVIVHGILHLLGYRDGNKHEIQRMRARENYHLKNSLTI